MVARVPAWKPQATLADVTTARRPTSSVTSSPRSALRSTTRSGIGQVDGSVVEGDAVPEPVVEGPGARVVGEHVEADRPVAVVTAPRRGGVHQSGAVALASLVLEDLDVVDERHRLVDVEPQPTDR